MKAKLPGTGVAGGDAGGTWPAFWLLAQNHVATDATPDVEIDVIEQFGNFNPEQMNMTYHHWTSTPTMQAFASAVGDMTLAYHTYGVSIEADWIIWYFDRIERGRMLTPPEAKTPMYLLVDLACSGSPPCNDVLTANPSNMLVEYINVYSKHPVVIPSAPTVTALSVSNGSTAGGTSVVLTGTNFTGATAVKFGATNAASYAVNGPTQITAVSPPEGAGVVNVTVTTAASTSTASLSNQFTYIAPPPPAPSVASITPTGGSTAGSTSVVIGGANFAGVTAVKFGAVNATSYVVNSAAQITAVAPAEGAGQVDVTVVAAAGTSAASANDNYTYVATGPPTVASISPSSGPPAGGTPVIITGTNFTSVTAVEFGLTPATSYSVTSPTSISATSPAYVGGASCSQATAFLARTTMTGTYAAAMSTLICGMVTDGTWCGSYFDVIQVYASDTAVDALLNLCSASKGSGTAYGSPAFSAGNGFTGVYTSTTVYIVTGDNPTSFAGNYMQNSAHISAWTCNNLEEAVAPIGYADGATSNANIFPWYNDGNSYARINDAVNSGGTAISSTLKSWFVANRSASGASQEYVNGALFASPNATSGAIPNANIYSLAFNNSGTPAGAEFQVALITIGGNIAPVAASVYARFNTYLSTVGACGTATPSAVDITVATAAGTSPTSSVDQFTYVAAGAPTFTLGSPSVLLTNAQRLAVLGCSSGAACQYFPDSPLGLVQIGGTNYILGTHSSSTAVITASTPSDGSTWTCYSCGTTLALGGSGAFDNGYAGAASVYYDAPSGLLITIYHGEYDYTQGFYSALGMAISSNAGASWTKLGQILTPWISRTSALAIGCYAVEVSGGNITIGPDGYVYLYYGDVPPGCAVLETPIAVARAPLADFLTAARTATLPSGGGLFQKYYNGSFSQNAMNATGDPTAGGNPFTQIFTLAYPQSEPSVQYDAALGVWIMAFAGQTCPCNATPQSGGGRPFSIYLSTSSDGISWVSPTVVATSSTDWLYYPTVVNLNNGANFQTLGTNFSIIYWDSINFMSNTSNPWANVQLVVVPVSSP